MSKPSDETRLTLPFKKLVGKANTSNDIPAFSEDIPSQISINIDEILGKSIPSDPQKGVDEGIVEYVELDLRKIVASNGLSYNLQFPSSYDGNLGTGVQGDNVRLHTQIVDKRNNPKQKAKPDHSGGYVYDLRDEFGNQIPSGSLENWIVDPVACILTSEKQIDELASGSGGKIRAYIYTEKTLDEVIASNNIDIQDNGELVRSGISTINFSSGLTASSFGETVSVNSSFESVTTDSISEGNDNLYYTDSRVDTRINESRPARTATFSGNAVRKQFIIPHGLKEKPNSWILTPVTDDASSFSHVQADDTNLYVIYDTPPPEGTNNIRVNWLVTKF